MSEEERIKKLVLIFTLIFLFSSCTAIHERYTGKRIRVEPTATEDYYDDYYSPQYYHYRPYYHSPFFWLGFSWWDPYFFWSPFYSYGLYNYYSWGYYPGYRYWGSSYYYPSRYGTSVIRKNQPKKRTIRRTPSSRLSGSSGRVRSTSGTKSRVSLSLRW